MNNSGLCILLFTLFILGCSENFEFPMESEFELTSSISEKNLNVGDELKVEAIFKNLSNNSYNLNSGATFTRSGLIHIKSYELDEQEFVMVGASRHVEISGGQSITEEGLFIMEKAGKYKIAVFSNFDIIDPKTNVLKKYNLKAEPIIIEVKK